MEFTERVRERSEVERLREAENKAHHDTREKQMERTQPRSERGAKQNTVEKGFSGLRSVCLKWILDP